MKKTKFYKRISVLLILFLLTIVFLSKTTLAQGENYCLTGTPSFTYTATNPPCPTCCLECPLGNDWYTDPLSINDDDPSTPVGACTMTPPFDPTPFRGTYTSTVVFDSVKPQVDTVEYLTWGRAYGQSGTITTSLYYGGSWNDIDTRTVNTHDGTWTPTGVPVTITSGGPWYNVERVRVYVDALSAPHYCIQTYIFEVRAFGPAAPAYQDIGLRVQTPTGIVSIAAEIGAPTSPLRIAKNGVIYGIVLVDPGDPNDSGVRIKTSSGIKALRKYP